MHAAIWVTMGLMVAAPPYVRQSDAGNEAAIRRLGGKVKRDPTLPGRPIVAVDLSETKAGDRDLALLAALPRLREINLRGTNVSGLGLQTLTTLKGVRELDLSRTKLGAGGLMHVGRLEGLEKLTLFDAGVGTYEVPGRKDSVGFDLSPLRRVAPLTLDRSDLTAAQKKALKGLDLRTLRELDLSGNPNLDDDGVGPLAGLPSLEALNLSRTGVTGTGLKDLKRLRTLDLTGAAVDDDGLKAVGRLENLRWVNLNGTKASKGGRGDLKKALPLLLLRD